MLNTINRQLPSISRIIVKNTTWVISSYPARRSRYRTDAAGKATLHIDIYCIHILTEAVVRIRMPYDR
jgi:hypothetical protein